MNPSPHFNHLNDNDFVAAFENCSFNPSDFHHADHVRLAWIYVHQVGAANAEQRLLEGIRHLAIHAGAPDKFLYTATVAWVRLVAAAVEIDPAELSFTDWIGNHPQLLNKDLLDQFYSAGLLKTDPARSHWVEPDRKPLKL